jgi:hypothetical protein
VTARHGKSSGDACRFVAGCGNHCRPIPIVVLDSGLHQILAGAYYRVWAAFALIEVNVRALWYVNLPRAVASAFASLLSRTHSETDPDNLAYAVGRRRVFQGLH